MYSLVAFVITLTELIITIGGYVLKSRNLVYNAMVYGSPFYLLKDLFTPDSALFYKNYIYVMILAFHILKYFIIFQAQRLDDRSLLRSGAIVFEATYLCLSAYYLM